MRADHCLLAKSHLGVDHRIGADLDTRREFRSGGDDRRVMDARHAASDLPQHRDQLRLGDQLIAYGCACRIFTDATRQAQLFGFER